MEDTQGILLKPREERLLNLTIDMPPGEDQQLEPPFDGEVRGKVFDSLSGSFTGTLTQTNWDGERLKGQLAANLNEIGSFIGNFEGTLDVKTWQIQGRAIGDFQDAGTENTSQLSLEIEACLRPLRRIDISQLVNGQPTNGTTVQVQVSIPDNPYDWKLPPTDTYVGVTIVEEAIMATEVVSYHILFYGGPEGYQTNRAQIALYGPNDNTVAFLRFNDPDMTFENDSESGGIIRMHLPSAMFENVLDVLRNEKPAYIYFAQGRGFLSTSKELVGEGE